ncbi:MAG: hypothetical protein GY711_21580 [bacterium]|nr:hypothetical protein [bacterium]
MCRFSVLRAARPSAFRATSSKRPELDVGDPLAVGDEAGPHGEHLEIALDVAHRERQLALRHWVRYRQLRRERQVLYPVLACALVSRPVDTLVFLAVPYLFGQWAIIAINQVQHDGCDPTSRYNHSRNHVGRLLIS